MTQLAAQLADLTGNKDRDALDVSLAFVLRELLRPRSVGIHRCVGEPGNERWITRARLGAGETTAASDPDWSEPESLVRLTDLPVRERAFTRARVVCVATANGHLSVFPLESNQQVVGALEIETSAALDDAARKLIDNVLRIFGNFQSLLDYSERDTLTGLLNRKTFDESFLKATADHPADLKLDRPERRVAQAEQVKHWLGVVDIDHFKRVNDSFGHLIGDEVLLLMARLMRGSFRFYDRLYRFGGEEFVVLMRCDSDASAQVAFERFRTKVESHEFPQVGGITISVGFTQVTVGDTPSAAFARADKAVYFAKSHGRNQVCGHADLVARGELVEANKVGDVELF